MGKDLSQREDNEHENESDSEDECSNESSDRDDNSTENADEKRPRGNTVCRASPSFECSCQRAVRKTSTMLISVANTSKRSSNQYRLLLTRRNWSNICGKVVRLALKEMRSNWIQIAIDNFPARSHWRKNITTILNSRDQRRRWINPSWKMVTPRKTSFRKFEWMTNLFPEVLLLFL